MKVQFLTHPQIDKALWDQTVEASKNYLPYAYSWYLDVVSPDWNALVTDDYQYIFPLTWKSKFLIPYLHQPYFTQQLGLLSPQLITDEVFNFFLTSLPANIRFVEINVNYANTFSVANFASTVRTNLELDLMQSYATIKTLYADNVKRNIAKAEKNGVTFQEHIPINDVVNLFRSNKGGELENFKPSHYHVLQKLYEVLKQKNNCFTAGAVKDGQLLTGALFIITAKRIVFLFSGNSEVGKQNGAMHYVIDQVIQNYSNTQRIFDFEGSNDANLARFYRSFGSVENVYLHLKKNTLPYLLRLIKK
jgi:hypothetical protein